MTIEPDCPCPDCGIVPAVGEWPFSCRGRGHTIRQRAAQPMDPVVIHRAKDGTVRYPGSSDAPAPPGYERVELRTFAEIDAFTKTANAKERSLIDRHIEAECAQIEYNEAQRRPDLRQAMQRMTPAQRAFAELAIRTNNAKRPKSFDPGVFVEIREQNASNREGYRDVRTNWKARK